MKKIYVFGHKQPDTDSICASISLSYLKNRMGFKTEAMTLGNINNETKFVLDYFNLEEPKYLNDVKLQIKDIDYIRGCYVNEKTSINDSFVYMRDNGLTGLPIVDDNTKLTGLVTLKELAKELIQGDFNLLNTSYDNIISILEGKEILRFDDEIKGNIIAASYRSTTFMESVKLTNEDILIVGDRHSILEYAINCKVKLIIIVGDLELHDHHIELAKENKVNIIKTQFNTFKTTKLINLSNYISTVSYCNNPVSIDHNDYYTKFEQIAMKSKHNNYPIVDKNGTCLGLLHLSLSITKHPKKVILVDHNEKDQSVDGLDEAIIEEVVDHHKLGTLATTLPINFRNMAVGSTNTIIYNIYKENNVEVPTEIAGAMLAGILSDTMILKSPTTTLLDKIAVFELEKIALVKYKEFGGEMFKAGSSLEGKTKEEILYQDFKKFKYENYNIGVGQIFTTDCDFILKNKDDYVSLLNNISSLENYKIICLFVTDIINNGSYVIYNTNSEEDIKDAFNIDNIFEGCYIENIISRKKQIIPNLLESLQKYS